MRWRDGKSPSNGLGRSETARSLAEKRQCREDHGKRGFGARVLNETPKTTVMPGTSDHLVWGVLATRWPRRTGALSRASTSQRAPSPRSNVPGQWLLPAAILDRVRTGLGGGRPVDAVAGFLSCGSRWNVARLHQIQRQARDVLVFGRLGTHPWTGRRAAGSSPRRPRNDRTVAPRRPRVGPDGSVGRPAVRRRRIMVVDDEPGIHLMARTTLEADGCEVIGATDGEAALEALRTRRGPDPPRPPHAAARRAGDPGPGPKDRRRYR